MSRPDYYVERYPMDAKIQPKTRELTYNQARCDICSRVVQGLPSGPWVKFRCRCGNGWQAKPVLLVPVVANGNGNAKSATCPECGHHFALTANGTNGNGVH